MLNDVKWNVVFNHVFFLSHNYSMPVSLAPFTVIYLNTIFLLQLCSKVTKLVDGVNLGVI